MLSVRDGGITGFYRPLGTRAPLSGHDVSGPIDGTGGIDQVAALIDSYRSCLSQQDKLFEGVWLNRVTCVVENNHQKEAARDFFAKALIALYDSWGYANVANMSRQQRRVEDICRNKLIIEEAQECREQIAAYAELDVRHIACLNSFGAPPVEVARRSIRLIGENIIPTLATIPTQGAGG